MQATRTAHALSTANTICSPTFPTRRFHHINAMRFPQSRRNRDGECVRDMTRVIRKSQQGMGMTEQQDRITREREEIAARVARFKATQEKFEREREEFFTTTLEKAKKTSRPSRPPFWS
jgi:hypothetical protein